MRRILLTIILLISIARLANAQQYGSQIVNAGVDKYSCGNGSPVSLTATFMQGNTSSYANSTSSYTVASIPFASNTFYLSSSGTSVSFANDDATNTIALPFSFCFYGNTYSTIYLNANGFISFKAVVGNSGLLPIAANNLTTNYNTDAQLLAFNNSIFGSWEDLAPTLGGTVNYNTIGTAPNRMFYVNFTNVPFYSANCNSSKASFQICLYETSNVIEIYTLSKDNCSQTTGNPANAGRAISGILGLAASGAGSPIPGRNNVSYAVSNVNPDAYRFLPNGAGNTTFSWLDSNTLSTVVGTTPTLTVTPSGFPHTYVAKLATVNCAGTATVITTDTMRVTQSNLTFSTIQMFQPNCNGTATGGFTFFGNTGSDPVDSLWTTPAVGTATLVLGTTDSIKGLPAGTYTVTARTTGGCTKTFTNINFPSSVSMILVDPSAVSFTAAIPNPYYIPCGVATYTLTVLNTGGTGSRTVTAFSTSTLTPTVASNIVSNIVSGSNYTVVVTDTKGCSVTTSFLATTPTPVVNNTTYFPISCIQKGTIIVNHTGGYTVAAIPTYSFTLSPAAGTVSYSPNANSYLAVATYTNVPKGIYTVTVSDRKNCSASTVITIDSTSAPTFSTNTVTNIACNPSATSGTFNGQALTYSSQGVTYTYSYTLQPTGTVNTTGIFTGLAAGNYSVAVTDNNNCTGIQAFTITQPSLQLGITPSNITSPGCYTQSNSGTFTVTAVNGVGATTWSITPNGSGETILPTTGNPAVATGLSATTYTVNVTDGNSCVASTSITISTPSKPSLNIVNPAAVCTPNTVNITTAAVQTINTGTTTNYYSTLALATVVGSTGDVVSPAAIAASNTYYIKTEQANLCDSIRSVAVVINPLPTVNPVSSQSVCVGSTTTLITFGGSAVAGTTYNWVAPNTLIGNSTTSGSGSLTAFAVSNGTSAPITTVFTVTPVANGCNGATTTFSITVMPIATVTAVGNQIQCPGLNTTAINFVGNGTSYSWLNNDNSIGNVFLSGSGNIAAFTTINPTGANKVVTYTVTPVSNGCNGTPKTFTITVRLTSTVTATPSSQTVCPNTTTTLVAFTGTGAAYNWVAPDLLIGNPLLNNSGNLPTFIAVNASGFAITKIFTVTPVATGCSGASTTFTITVQPTASVTATPSTQTVCPNLPTSIVVFSGTGTTYNWLALNTTIGNPATSGSGNLASFTGVNATNVIKTTIFTVTAVANSCNGATTTFSISVQPTATVTPIPSQTVCPGGNTNAINFVGTGSTYTWVNTDGTIGNGSTTGLGNIASFVAVNATTVSKVVTYTVTPISNGCNGATTTFTITVQPTATVTATASTQTVCPNTPTATVVFSGTGTTYTWTASSTAIGNAISGSGNLLSFTASNPSGVAVTTIFTVTPVSNGCNGATTTFSITVQPTATVTATPSTQTVCPNSPTTIVVFSGTGTTYNWLAQNTTIGNAINGSGNLLSFTALNPTGIPITTVFTVTPVSNGCNGATATFSITVQPTATVTSAPSTQTVCPNSPTATVVLSGTGTTYNWLAQNTTIGNLTTSGSGNLVSFTAKNLTGLPITSIFTVTPVSNGCNGGTTTFSITVQPIATVTASASTQTVCPNTPTATVVFSGTGTTYTWTASSIAIGNAISGSGNLLSFTASNPLGVAVTTIFTVTAVSNGCNGATTTFSITVQPTATVTATPSTQTVCPNSPTIPVVFTGTGTIYSWTAQNTTIGNALSGTGNLLSFTALNPTGLPITTVFTVTPVSNGCNGATTTFSITVLPTATVTVAPSTQTVCPNTPTATVVFSGTGTTYTWTASSNAIGNALNGTGNLTSFIASNPSGLPITTIFTVTAVSNGCNGATTTFSITVLPTATVTATASTQTVCPNTATATVVLSGTGTIYNWVASSISAGNLPNGSGNLPSFTASNPSGVAVTTIFTVTPVSNGCNGATTTFSITVQPTATVTATPSTQTVCPNSPTIPVVFTGTGISYDWVASNTLIGNPSSGFNTVLSFIALNPSNVPITTVFTVTAVSNGCNGATTTFSITVLPTATVTAAPSTQTVCPNTPTATVVFSGTGTTYTWTASSNAIGNALSGSGDLVSFTASNPSGIAVTTVFTVTAVSNGCNGATTTFSITVLPTATVTATASTQTVCPNTPTTTVVFSGTGTSYDWVAGSISAGNLPNGSGNLTSFIASNPSGIAVTTVFTVTAVSNGCNGATTTFSITIQPTTTVTATPSTQTVCPNSPTIPVVFTGTGTSNNWFAPDLIIGNPGVAGTNTLLSFIALNPTSIPITKIFTVTPVSNTCNGASTTFSITVQPTVTVTPVSSQTICSGFSTSNINFTGTGSTYTWTANNNAIGNALSGSGNIASFIGTNITSSPIITTFTVMPIAIGCNGLPITFSITVNPLPTFTITSASNPGCGLLVHKGEFIVLGSGGTPYAGIKYSWSVTPTGISTITPATISNPATIDSLGTGSYHITVTDFNGCSASKDSVLSNPGSPIINITSTRAISCNSACDGAIFYTITNGTKIVTPAQLTYSPVVGGAVKNLDSLVNLCANYYTFSITDSNSCQASAGDSVKQINPITVSLTQDSVRCFGGSTGTITATATGGNVGGYYYKLNAGAYKPLNVNTFTNVPAGIYTITSKDTKGCTGMNTISVLQPSTLTLTASPTNPLCNGGSGSITFSALGGTPAYTYSVNSVSNSSPFPTPALTVNTPYTIEAKDANGCMATQVVTVTVPSTLTLTASGVSPICNGGTGTLTFSASGGTTAYTYSVNTVQKVSPLPTPTLTVNTAFVIDVKDANGCMATQIVTVTVPSTLTLTASEVSPLCNGSTGTLTFSATGGTTAYTYKVNNVTELSPLPTPTLTANASYTIEATDGNGCKSTQVVTVTVPNALTLTASPTSPLCNGGSGSITFSALGGTPAYTYSVNSVSNSSPFPTPALTVNTTYTIEAKDANGCMATQVVTVTVPSTLPTFTITSASNPGCGFLVHKGEFIVLGSGGTPYAGNKYSWLVTPTGISTITPATISNPATIDSLGTGSYHITVTDFNGCTASKDSVLSNPGSPIINITSTRAISCNSACDGAIFYTITNGTKIVTPAQLTYSPVVGGAVKNLDSLVNLCANYYTFSITDSNSCQASAGDSVKQINPITVSLTQDSVRCFGDSTGTITATATGGNVGGYYYKLNAGAYQALNVNTFTNVPAGIYTITSKDTKGCIGMNTITVLQPSAVTVTATTPNINCFGKDTTITAIGAGGNSPYQYSLNGGAYQAFGVNIFSGNTANSYTISTKDAYGCIATTTITVTQPSTALTATITAVVNPGCGAFANAGAYTVTTSGGTAAYIYSNGIVTTANTGVVSGKSTGTYTTTVTDFKGCIVNVSTTLSNASAPTSTVTPVAVSCAGICDGSVSLNTNGGLAPYTYVWTCSPSIVNSATSLCTGTCTVTTTDANSCTTSNVFTISSPAVITATGTTSVNPSSAVLNNGSITVTGVTGGTAPYKYWLDSNGVVKQGPQVSNVFNNLFAGTYRVYVTSNVICDTIKYTVVLSAPTYLTCTVTSTPEKCVGTNDGTITVNVGGSVGPYSYTNIGAVVPVLSADVNHITATYSPLAPNPSYSLIVTAFNGDTVHCFSSITPAVAIVPSVAKIDATCAPLSGSLIVDATGGAGVKHAIIFQGATYVDSSITLQHTFAVDSNIYTIVIRDANGCTTSSTKIISTPTPLTYSLNSTSVESCSPGMDGCVNFTVNNKVGNLSLSVNGGALLYQTTNTYNGCIYAANNYTVHIIDTLTKCFVDGTFTINPSLKPDIDTIATSPSACTGACSGTVTVTATSGTSPYTYSVDGAAYVATTTLTGLCATGHTLMVKDAKGCLDTMNISIGNPNAPVVSISNVVDAKCAPANSGSVTLSIASASAYTISVASSSGTTTTTSNIINNLVAGAYAFTVTDAMGCSSFVSTSIGTKASPTINYNSSIPPVCNADSNGSVSFTAVGSTTITINGTAKTNATFIGASSITGLKGGTYTITAYNADSCSAFIVGTITPPSALTLSLVGSTTVTVFGGHDGTITATGSGGTGALTYSIDHIGAFGTQSGNVFSNLYAGIYTITLKDANNCSTTTTFTIANPGQIVLTVDSFKSPLCNGGTDGKIYVTTSNAVAPFTVTSSAGGTVVNASPHAIISGAAGDYTITTTDGTGLATTSTVVTILPSPIFTISSISITNPSCIPSTNGAAVVSLSGGTGASTYTLNGVSYANGATATGLSATTYIINATDANGCATTSSITLTAPTPPTASVITTHASCVPNNNGTAAISVVSPNGAYTITPANTTSLTAGVTTYTITDALGCTTTTTATVTPQPKPNITIGTITPPNCAGDSNATVAYTSTGTIALSGSAVSNTTSHTTTLISGLKVGNLTITSTNIYGCDSIKTITINPATAVTATAVGTNVTIAGANNGVITVTPSGGTAGYTVSINSGSGATIVGNTFSNLLSGCYTFTINDAHNCVFIDTFCINEPNAIVINVSSTSITCNGNNTGAFTVSASGGVPFAGNNYNWLLTNPNATTVSINNSNFVPINGLVVGTYTVKVTDANGGTKETTVTISEPSTKPTVTSVLLVNPKCKPANSGSITLNATGGTGAINYTVTNTTSGVIVANNIAQGTTVNSLPFGTYSILATDANGCITTTTVSLLQLPNPIITSTSTTKESCVPGNDGTITINATSSNGPLTYGFNSTALNLNNTFTVSANTYNVFAIDSAGCFTSKVDSVLHQPNPIITNVDTTFALCSPAASASITVHATGNTLQYSIDNGVYQASNSFTSLLNGPHTVSVKDMYGCKHDTTLTIYTLNAPTLTKISTTPGGCNPANNGGFVINTTAVGTGVTYSNTIAGASVTLLNGVITGTGLIAGIYTISVIDAVTLCTIKDTVVVPHTPQIAIVNVLNKQPLCFGDSTGAIKVNTNITIDTLKVTNTTTGYTWWTNADSINNIPFGNYSVQAIDVYGCTATNTIFINQPPLLTYTSHTVTPIKCNGDCNGTFNVATTGGTGTIIYSITNVNPNNTTGNFAGLCPNNYTITATDLNGCMAKISDSVKNVNPLIFNAPTITNVLPCNGDSTGSICITATGGNGGYIYINQYATNYTGGCFTNLWADTYSITVTDIKNCSVTSTYTVSQPTLIVINVDSINNVKCFSQNNGNFGISVTGGLAPYKYSFNGGAYTNASSHNNLIASVYTMQVKDANGCSKVSTTITITEPAILSLNNLTFINVLCNGTSSGIITPNVTGGTMPYTTILTPGSISLGAATAFTGLKANTYTITTTDVNSCPTTTTVTISEPPPISPIVNVTNINCFGNNTGSICVTPIGGVAPFQYKFNNGVFGSDSCFYGLAAGTYTIDIKDANHCNQQTIITITQPSAPLTIVQPITTVNINCYGDSTGSITMKASGGTQLNGGISYNFGINGPISALTTNNVTATSCLFNNLKAGLFYITVSDGKGCTASTSVTLTQNPKIYIASIKYTEPHCFGEKNGEVHIKALGGSPALTYALSPTNNAFQATGDFLNLAARNYIIHVQDALGCKLDSNYTLDQPKPLQFSLMNIGSVSCESAKNGTLQTLAIGGNGFYKYLVTPGVRANRTGVFGGFSVGNYVVSVIDTLGCKTDTNITIGYTNNPITLNTIQQDINNCNGLGLDGKADANPSGGAFPYTFMWSTIPAQTTQVATGLAPGYYIVDVTDADGCIVSDTIVIAAADNCCDKVILPTVFSPNHDGNNDVFRAINSVALNITLLDFNIYDRWGNRVFNTVGIADAWDGTYRDMPAEEGVYQFMYRYRCNTDNKIHLITGDVMLVR